MANVNSPFGFQPVMLNLGGGPLSVRTYGKPASDANAISMFDLVCKVASSVALADDGSIPAPSIKSYYNGATPGTTLILGTAINYGAASTLTDHKVYDEINQLLIAQCSGATSISVASHVGKNANVTAATVSANKKSGLQIDSATIATTAGLDLRIRDLYRLIPNAEGANAICEVLILKHANAQGSAGV
jgi:hypothetical protein